MDTNARVAVLEGWRETHEAEHCTVWRKLDIAYDRSLSLEAKMAVYSSVGGFIGSIIGGIIVWFLTR